MSKVLKSLKIFDFDNLYLFTKLSFLSSIKNNEITSHIFKSLTQMKKNKLSKSFYQDIKFLEERLSSDILDIYRESEGYKKSLRLKLRERDGVSDSIDTCLRNYKNKYYKTLLKNLVKPKFIQEHDEFQEL